LTNQHRVEIRPELSQSIEIATVSKYLTLYSHTQLVPCWSLLCLPSILAVAIQNIKPQNLTQ
jgi:hypothetical protein